jgi:uncharacterized protein with von Willebrand factor type A (vWA) domain
VDREELLKLLDLSGKETIATEEPLDIRPGEAGKVERPKPASPTALQLDDWARRKGHELLKESDRLRDLKLDAHAVADFHGCAFEADPRLGEDCVDPRRRDFIEALLETPDYHALHQTTLLNAAASALATVAFAEQFAALKEEHDRHELDKDLGKKEAKGPGEEEHAAIEREMETLRAVGKALTKAEKDVEEMLEAAAALGLGPGSPGSNDPKAIARLFKRVRASPILQRICTLAGRFRRVAQSKQRRKAIHGYDDVVGVTLDGEIARLLPVELTRLVLDDLELDTLRRLVERQALCRQHQSVEPVAKGPILITVDESGSMEGRKVETAKALALALAWIARQQRRWCGLVAFSGDSGHRLLALPPGRWDENALAEWLEQFIGCGSCLDVPIEELPHFYRCLRCPVGVTDVLMITDALCRIPGELKESFRAWKAQAQARVISLVIHSHAGDLNDVSDEVHLVEALSAEDEAVGRVLSL